MLCVAAALAVDFAAVPTNLKASSAAFLSGYGKAAEAIIWFAKVDFTEAGLAHKFKAKGQLWVVDVPSGLDLAWSNVNQ